MNFLDAAADLVSLGFRVIPLMPGKKLPLVKAWQRMASDELETLCRWAKQWPDANIGVATGAASGVLVLDLDVKDGRNGIATIDRLAASGKRLPAAPLVATPSGGRHLFFRMEPGVKNVVGITRGGRGFGDGVDVRAAGGFVVAPPSVLENGSYRWLVPAMTPTFPRLPDWAAAMLRPKEQLPRQPFAAKAVDETDRAQRSLEAMARSVASAPSGCRNSLLNWAAFHAGNLARNGKLSSGEISARLMQAAAAAGLPRPEAEATIASGLRGALSGGVA